LAQLSLGRGGGGGGAGGRGDVLRRRTRRCVDLRCRVAFGSCDGVSGRIRSEPGGGELA